ncbi:MAG: methyltransferase domain-containing protein [Rhodocyclaceae bacterium]|nr:methyltransferase domain-containing protein [Rhodocyclaceae bacterium]
MSFHEQFWTSRYREVGEDYLFGTAPTRFMETHAGLFSSGSTALSVADGEGRNSVWLAEQGLAVTALEISPVALEKARKLAAGKAVAVDFRLGDVLDWDWPKDAFDFVAAVFIQFTAPAERLRLFADMQAAVKPGGLLLLHGYTPKQLEYKTGGPPSVDHLYTPELLRDAFAGWDIRELREYEDDLEEGSGHRGRSALIDLVARKPGK